MTDSVKKTVTVPLAPAEAFALFTGGLDGWWPKKTHSLGAAKGDGNRSRLSVEPRPGGRVTETLADGTRSLWGTVTHWEPGRRFGLDWHLGREPEEATGVVVVFTPTDAGTRVDLTHSAGAALGPKSAGVSACYDTGWDLVLGTCYAPACRRACMPAA